jgi:hypothetical protein
MSNGLYEVEDWTDFRSLDGLGRRAGVPVDDIPKVVVKELVDNAYDAGASCEFEMPAGNAVLVRDDGPGIPGTPEDIADLFSIKRPRKSSKIIRLPTRGMLGNGLRVVTGAVLATGGSLVVRTRGREICLEPREDGTTEVLSVRPWDGSGTEVEVTFGRPLSDLNVDIFSWAKVARVLAGRGTTYKGKSSPWWYDADSFWELMQAAGKQTVREVAAKLEGCGRQKAGDITADFHGRTADNLTREEAGRLLTGARQSSKPVKPDRLGCVGKLDGYKGYARVTGEFRVTAARGVQGGTIPYAVEAWASEEDEPGVILCVNRTPVTPDVSLYRSSSDKGKYFISGCGLSHRFPVNRNRDYLLLVNVQCPHVALTSEGKAPDLSPLADEILDAVEKACRRGREGSTANGNGNKEGPRTFTAAVKTVLDDAIAYVSDNGEIRYGQRHLFYRVREQVQGIAPQLEELKWGRFCCIVAEIEEERGHDLPGMYRDYRGVIYHPHLHEDIPLGTLSVEQYERPEWTFNKILYIEKDSFFQTLKEAGFPERYDCALLTSKGQATRAVKDILDLLPESGEPIKVCLAHDADGYGTVIYDKTQNATIARPGRKVEIVNFGLEPEEALAMGLEPEAVKRKNNKKVPVGDYVSDEWREWYQRYRIELDAMPPRQFLTWIERKMKEHGFTEKVIPPVDVQAKELNDKLKDRLKDAITGEILEDADIDSRVEEALGDLDKDIGKATRKLDKTIRKDLKANPQESWREPVGRVVDELAALRNKDDEEAS